MTPAARNGATTKNSAEPKTAVAFRMAATSLISNCALCPPPHPRLVSSIRITELALKISLLPPDHPHIHHPHQRHREEDRPQAPRRDAQPHVDEDRSQIERVPRALINAVNDECRRRQVRRNIRARGHKAPRAQADHHKAT